MKRIGFIYEKIYDISNIKQAIYLASRNKMKRSDVKRYLNNVDFHAKHISCLLRTQKYAFTKGVSKRINETTKVRIITIPKFRDLIVQYAILNVIKPILFKGMYKWSCGSIPKRGNLYAKRYTEKIVRKYKPKYALKLDVKKFYHNVDIEVLYNQLKTKIKDEKVLKLIWQLLEIGSVNNKGIPIGFYTSQWFSNFYLTNLDNYIKQELKAKHYVRYVDDMYIFGNNKRQLHKMKREIINYLKVVLLLEPKHNYQIFKIEKRGVDFVGYVYSHNKTQLRKRNFIMFHKRKRQIQDKINIFYARSFISYHSWFCHLGKNFVLRYNHLKNKATKYISKYDKGVKVYD